MLARWNPWQELFDVEREMRDLSRRVFGSGWFAPVSIEGGGPAVWTPALDVFSRDGDLIVRAELPGIDPEKDVEITVENGVLTIKGERRHEEKTEKENYYRFESSYGSFQRSVPLPKDVKADDIAASYENGILEVVVPKAGELSASRKIPVKAGSSRKAITAEGEKK
jgi:HSP20 family protein